MNWYGIFKGYPRDGYKDWLEPLKEVSRIVHEASVHSRGLTKGEYFKCIHLIIESASFRHSTVLEISSMFDEKKEVTQTFHDNTSFVLRRLSSILRNYYQPFSHIYLELINDLNSAYVEDIGNCKRIIEFIKNGDGEDEYKRVGEESKPLLEIVKELHEKGVVSSYMANPNNLSIHFNKKVVRNLDFDTIVINIPFGEGKENRYVAYTQKRLTTLLEKANEHI